MTALNCSYKTPSLVESHTVHFFSPFVHSTTMEEPPSRHHPCLLLSVIERSRGVVLVQVGLLLNLDPTFSLAR